MTGSIELWEQEPIDFSIAHEGFSRYRLEDGSIVLAKMMVAKFYSIIKETPETRGKYYSSTSLILTTICPKELRGKPTEPIPDANKIPKEELIPMKFEQEFAPWNQYELADGTTIFTQTIVMEVHRTSFFAQDGDPMYIVNTGQRAFRIDKEGQVHAIPGSIPKPTEASSGGGGASSRGGAIQAFGPQ